MWIGTKVGEASIHSSIGIEQLTVLSLLMNELMLLSTCKKENIFGRERYL